MDYREKQIHKLVSKYDSTLFAKKDGSGVIHVYRKAKKAERMKYKGMSLVYIKDISHYIFSITDNWKEYGISVDRGDVPIWQQLLAIDSWRDDSDYDAFCKRRENREYWKERTRKNEIRALAADCRRDFAKAVNDINTSTIK